MKLFSKCLFLFFLCLILSCRKDVQLVTLDKYISQNNQYNLALHKLIACAAGGQKGFLDDNNFPVSVFYYPVQGAHEFRYFETQSAEINQYDYSQYYEKFLCDEPVFNGYLRRFKDGKPPQKDVWGIVSYKVGNELRVCDPIRLKIFSKPTEFASQLLSITKDSITPLFQWQDGRIKENKIYFEVVSDSLGNLISGTYTYDKWFRFYDLSNVVLNITYSTPALAHNSRYTFTLMGVSKDNWVNLIAQKQFSTH